jgi:hypothetical protein
MFIHNKAKNLNQCLLTDLGSVLRAAVAQRIEQHSDEFAGRGFESYQRYARKVASRFVAWGHFHFLTQSNYLLSN